MVETQALVSGYLDQVFSYGSFWVYLIIFTACFIENIFPPFPGDTFIIVGGILVGLGRLELWIIAPLVIIGGMSSVMVLYYLGHRYGREFFLRKNYRIFSVNDITRSERQLSKRGWALLIISRFLIGIRAAIAVVSGIARYNPLKMFLFSTMSYVLFTGLVMYLSISLVENIEGIDYYLDAYKMVVWPIVTIIVLAWVISKLRNSKAGV